MIYKTKHLTIKTKPQSSLKPKIFIRIGKSFVKKAVRRNLIKRRLRAILGKFSQKGRDCLVLYNSADSNPLYRELEEEVRSLS